MQFTQNGPMHLVQRFNNQYQLKEKSLYPFNHVIETESGHYVEIDDTKDNERIHVYHKTGTFLEIDPLGNIILKTPDTVKRLPLSEAILTLTLVG